MFKITQQSVGIVYNTKCDYVETKKKHRMLTNELFICISNDGLVFRLNTDPDLKLSSVGWSLVFVFCCAHRGLTDGFP